jgi:hypothetical protein
VTYAFNSSLTALPFGGASDPATAFTLANSFAVLGHVVGPGRDEDEPLTELLFNLTTAEESGLSNSISRSISGLLTPGEYFLYTVAQSFATNVHVTGSEAAGFAFTLDFAPAQPSPTPEPASVLLLGTALASVFGYRRRSHKSPR